MTAADHDSLHFGCPQCMKRLKAPASLAGTRSRCPFCQKPFDVPLHSRSNEAVEEYSLHLGDDSLLDQPACVLVVCPVCHARMHPEESLIGQKVTCPDCGTQVVVIRPTEEPAKPSRPSADVGAYPLATETRRSASVVPAAEEDYVAVLCPLCHTRMLATADQVGSKLICPDCGTPAPVPPMPAKRPKIDVMAGSDDTYDLAGWNEPAPSKPTRTSSPSSAIDEPPPKREEKPISRRPVLPAQPFFDGTFSFPFSRGVLGHTVLLTVWAILPSLAWYGSVTLGRSENVASAFGSAMCFGAMMVCGLIWYGSLAACVLVVLRDTAEGCDEIVNWPGHVFIDWAGDSMYLFLALCASVVPGTAVAWGLAMLGISANVFVPLGMFFAFPIVLMSMLETNSAFGVASWPVLRTLGSAATGWIKFYVASGMLVVATCIVELVAFRLNGLFGVLVAAATQSAAWIIYFRLLGRLAWYCADRAAIAELESQLNEWDDEDFDEEEDTP